MKNLMIAKYYTFTSENERFRSLINKLTDITPSAIVTFLQILKFDRIFSAIINPPKDKYLSALIFQIKWVNEFKKNQLLVLENWKKYRCFDEIQSICRITKDSMILDVGCGISTVLHFVEGRKFGIDPLANEFLKLYKYPSDIKIKKGSGERIPFLNEYFDIVYCTNVLDHVADPIKTIDEIYRVLKVNGKFVLTVDIFKERIKRDLKHPHSFLEEDINSLVGEKFKIIFSKVTPRIGLKAYVNGVRKSDKEQFVVVMNKNLLL